MNYRPDANTLLLWDTWMFPDPDGRRMHLFFLANRPNESWGWVGHAVSDDLIHWQDLPAIQVRHPSDTYDVGMIGTGMVFRKSSGYMMSYTANLEANSNHKVKMQSISFLHSDDLINWEKRWPEPRIVAQPPYYETDGTKAICNSPAFGAAYIHRVGDHYEALIAGHSTGGPVLLRGCIARYRSADGELRNWEALPPLIGPNVTALMEVPEHFQIGNKHYLLWSTSSHLGVACDTTSRRACWGTFYAFANSYEGPYSVPEDNMLIGAGNGWHSYVGRISTWRNECILYHHMSGPCPSAAFPKRVLQQNDGTLKLGYWPGIEAVHTKEIVLPLDRIAVQGENIQAGSWERIGLDGLRGSIDGGGTLGLVPGEIEDLHLRCRVTLKSGTRFGISLRDPGQFKDRERRIRSETTGVALQGDIRYGEWQFGTPKHSWCSRIEPVEIISEAPKIGQIYQIDLIVRDIYFEAYVDGIWKFTRIINDRARKGGIGFFVEDGVAIFEGIKGWELESMLHPFPGEWPV